MSMLLALLRSPVRGSRRRQDVRQQELYTEMGMLSCRSREATELLEVPSPAELPVESIKEQNSTLLLPCSACSSEYPSDTDGSFRAAAAAEVTFAYECLSSATSASSSITAQEALERLCCSGAILCELLSSAIPGSLDERAINMDEDNLTVDDVRENFQLALSCAHAQGCDVQGLSLERLEALEVSRLTDFVLEVLRLSAAQDLPAPDCQVLLGPAPHDPVGSFRATKSRTLPPRSVPPSSDSLHVLGTEPSPGECDTLVADNTCTFSLGAGAAGHVGSSSSVDHGANSAARDFEQSLSANQYSYGTAAARRAVAGLQSWALQLVGMPHTETSWLPPYMGTATPTDNHHAISRDLTSHKLLSQLPSTTPNATDAVAICPRNYNPSSASDLGHVQTGLTDDVLLDAGGGGGGATIRHLNVATIGRGESQGAVASSGADPLGLEVWETLSSILSLPLRKEDSIQDDNSGVHGASGVAEEHGSTPATTSRGLSGVGAGPLSTAAATAMTDLHTTLPSGFVHGDDNVQRWAATAEALSKALAAEAPTFKSQLPELRAEHLQCCHPGLRSLVLTRALVTYCRLRDGPRTPYVATAAVTARAAERGRDSNTSCDELRSRELMHVEDASGEDAMAAEVGVAAATAAKLLSASPAPPVPLPKQPSMGILESLAPRRRGTTGGRRLDMDVLSEHNLLVQKKHQQREWRRQQQQDGITAGSCGGAVGDDRGRARAAAGEATAVLWSGDEDEEGTDQEERVLRLWLNSLDPGIHVSSLFAKEVATGWPLLLALEAIQPGCVPWSEAFQTPFKEKLCKILSVQNCNLVIEVCTRQLAMPPLVNIGGLDLALGQRRATLSLVFQMMRHHMGKLLGLAAPHPHPLPTSPYQTSASAPVDNLSPPTPHHHHHHHQPQKYAGSGLGYTSSLGHGFDASLHASPHCPSPRGFRAHVEVEKAVLAWANAKLTEAAAAATAAAGVGAAEVIGGDDTVAVAPQLPFQVLASFSDKRLSEGRVLLQLLAAICPRSVNPLYVLPGRSTEERGSNARYLLSCARKMGCVIFLSWEDVLAARPNLLLLLLASFMALDRKKAGTGTTVGDALVAAAATAACRVTAGAPGGGSASFTQPSALLVEQLP